MVSDRRGVEVPLSATRRECAAIVDRRAPGGPGVAAGRGKRERARISGPLERETRRVYVHTRPTGVCEVRRASVGGFSGCSERLPLGGRLVGTRTKSVGATMSDGKRLVAELPFF